VASSSPLSRVDVGARFASFARRHLISMILLAVAALALGLPVSRASTDDPVIAGRTSYAGARTQIVSTSGDGLDASTSEQDALYAGVSGYNAGSGDGVVGASASGYGVEALTQTGSAGVFGVSSGRGSGVEGLGSGANGVYGHSNSPTASGVYGENLSGAGYGVAGRVAGGRGVAVLADDESGSGVALRTTGRLQLLNRSGLATVAAGHAVTRVPVVGVTAKSMVIATVQQAGGFAVQAAVPAAGSFTIHLNKAAPGSSTVKVAYLVLD
jgi:hypothetical protein